MTHPDYLRNKAREMRAERGLTIDEIAERLALDPTFFRDFVCMYLGEGSKSQRGTVGICNSDPAVVLLGAHWICRLGRGRIVYRLQFHADQDLVELRRFWAGMLGIADDQIKFQRKSNSNQLAGRSWRSQHGVLMVRMGDTLLRARLQAWMDRVREDWRPMGPTGAN